MILEQTMNDRASSPIILSNLIEMGLVRMVANPDDPDDVMLDSRMLQAVLAEYGPRVTTASGDLGVSVSRGGIWTPGSDAPTGGATTPGGIWTPGSTAPPTDEPEQKPRPNLFIPGR